MGRETQVHSDRCAMSWSHAAAILCGILALFCWIPFTVAYFLGWADRPERLPPPGKDWKRNGTESVGRIE